VDAPAPAATPIDLLFPVVARLAPQPSGEIARLLVHEISVEQGQRLRGDAGVCRLAALRAVSQRSRTSSIGTIIDRFRNTYTVRREASSSLDAFQILSGSLLPSSAAGGIPGRRSGRTSSCSDAR